MTSYQYLMLPDLRSPVTILAMLVGAIGSARLWLQGASSIRGRTVRFILIVSLLAIPLGVYWALIFVRFTPGYDPSLVMAPIVLLGVFVTGPALLGFVLGSLACGIASAVRAARQ